MSSTRRAATWLLLLFLLWRGLNSAYVCIVDTSTSADWIAGLTDDRRGRIVRATRLPLPGVPDDTHFERLRLLEQDVPIAGKVYVLHSFSGPMGLLEYRSYQRIAWLLYPRPSQMITALPLPPSSTQPPLGDKPTFVFDVRNTGEDLGPEYQRVGAAGGGTLWRKRP